MVTIEPIDRQQQQQVVALTERYLRQAHSLYGRDFPVIPILFDLRGRSAGMYRIQRGERAIRYNPYLFAKYFEDNLANTVPHEVAHYVVEQLYGRRRVQPHGREWQRVMQDFGAEPSRTCNYDLEGIPVRQQRRFEYSCGCTSYQLTAYRHNKLQRKETRYFCRQCRGELVAAC